MTGDKTKKAKWSGKEVELLVEEVSNRKDIGQKFSPGFRAADRTKFWAETTQKINAVGGRERSVVQVEKKWRDLKSQTKSKEANRRKELFKTGGGSSKAEGLSCLEEKILGTLPSCTLEGIPGGKDVSLSKQQGESLGEETDTVTQVVLETRSDKEGMFGDESIKITNSKEANFEKGTQSKRDSKMNNDSDDKPARKRKLDPTEEFIHDIEQKKLEELQGIGQTLKSIDSTLKKLLELKRSRKENIEDSVYHHFNFEI